MLPIPRRHSHYALSVIQSGLTCAIAAAIACLPFRAEGSVIAHWWQAWLLAWTTMLPVVLAAAPAIRRLAVLLTRDET